MVTSRFVLFRVDSSVIHPMWCLACTIDEWKGLRSTLKGASYYQHGSQIGRDLRDPRNQLLEIWNSALSSSCYDLSDQICARWRSACEVGTTPTWTSLLRTCDECSTTAELTTTLTRTSIVTSPPSMPYSHGKCAKQAFGTIHPRPCPLPSPSVALFPLTLVQIWPI